MFFKVKVLTGLTDMVKLRPLEVLNFGFHYFSMDYLALFSAHTKTNQDKIR